MITEDSNLVAEQLLFGDLVAIPTETVYELAANIHNEAAVKKIFELKQRPLTNPLIVHIHSIEQISELAALNDQQTQQVQNLSKFWPGPLTLVLPKKENISNLISANTNTIAVRIPNHPLCLELLRTCNVPLAAPSANIANRPSPTLAKHVQEEFGEELLVLDGGPCQVGLESTVVSLLESDPKILRPGGITPEMLNIDVISSGKEAPGQSLKHYSPTTKISFKKDYQGNPASQKTAYIAFSENTPEEINKYHLYKELSPNNNLAEVARLLFATIRDLDRQKLDLILVDSCPEEGIGIAIMDRLRRATGTHLNKITN